MDPSTIDFSSLAAFLSAWAPPVIIQALVGWQTVRIVGARLARLETRCEKQHGPLEALPQAQGMPTKILGLVLVPLLAVSLSGCATFGQAAQKWASCTLKDAAPAAVDSARELAVAAAMGEQALKDKAATLGITFGFDAVKCLVAIAIEEVGREVQRTALNDGGTHLVLPAGHDSLRVALGRLQGYQAGIEAR